MAVSAGNHDACSSLVCYGHSSSLALSLFLVRVSVADGQAPAKRRYESLRANYPFLTPYLVDMDEITDPELEQYAIGQGFTM